MSQETIENCKYCWAINCLASEVIEEKYIPNICPCIDCLVKTMCSEMCKERIEFSKLVLPQSSRSVVRLLVRKAYPELNQRPIQSINTKGFHENE